MKSKGPLILTTVLAVLVTGAMLLIEGVLQPGYWLKSACKMALMVSAVLLYVHFYSGKLTDNIGLVKKLPDRKLMIWCGVIYLFIIAVYLLFRNQIDLSSIRENLLEKEELNSGNYLYIFSYIIIVNSFLEEAFFRGFIVEAFKKNGYALAGVIISSILFGIYHMGIVATWFNPFVYVICVGGLTVAGMFLCWIKESNGTLLASWMVHAAANLAINTIGVFMMLNF